MLRGDGENHTLRLSSHGTMFTVSQNVTAILDDNITLHGHAENTAPLVVINGGTARMRTGSTITGNTNIHSGPLWARRGHAVFVNDNTRRETTAGPGVNLSFDRSRRTGGWES